MRNFELTYLLFFFRSYHLMIGGALLFEFCLFMISISQPEQYYQV